MKNDEEGRNTQSNRTGGGGSTIPYSMMGSTGMNFQMGPDLNK